MGIIFSEKIYDAVALLTILSTLIYFYVKRLYQYWDRSGVKSYKPTFPFGNLTPVARQSLSFGDLTTKFYNETTEPFIGVYAGFTPVILFRDPELIQHVFIKDFSNFVDRGFLIDEKNDPLTGHLFAMEGDKWRNLRGKLTPTFTSGKIKGMFTTLLDCGEPLTKYVDNISGAQESIEIRELLAQYTTNVIASVAFGLEIDCIGNPDQDFRKYGRKVFG